MARELLKNCPNCNTRILVKNLITDSLAECGECGQTVSLLPNDAATRNAEHSPAPQRNTQKF